MASRPTVHRVRLTKAGWYWVGVTVALVGIALFKNINLLLVIGCFVLVLLVVNWLQVRRGLRRVTVDVDLPEGVHANGTARANILLTNWSRRSLHRLDCALTWAGLTSVTQPASVMAKGHIGQIHFLHPKQRGIVESARLELRHSYPFGLVEAVRQHDVPCQCWVYPSCGELELERLIRRLKGKAAIRGQRRLAVRHLSEGTDIHGLRPFRAGDSPRWIHWRTTARIGTPMVRELDRSAGSSLIVAADLVDSTPGHAEATLAFMASFVVTWSQSQDGRLTLAFTAEGGWRRIDLDHRRGAITALKGLAEWPVISTTSRPWPVGDARFNVARTPIVVAAPTRVVPAGLTGYVLSVDPARTSPYYRPPEVLNV